MKLLSCASYYGTGSSAITDILNECDNVHSLGDYEFRFVQDPDGICDLEYNLVQNNHRHNSGYALKRYEKNVRYLNGNRIIKKYNQYFGDEWIKLSEQYVHDLMDLEYIGYWHQDVRDKGPIIYFIERLLNKIMHDVVKVDRDRNYTLFMKNYTNYVSYPEEKFYQITRDYIDKLFQVANSDNKEYVMVDQLVPPSNTNHYLRLFNDLKVVCVSRDPRDLYILERKYWNGTIIPHDVREYCIWFKTTRKHLKYENDDTSRILRIDFEDLIYKYEDCVERVLSFCGIDKSHHTAPRTKLIPEISVKNTRLFINNTEYKHEIEFIEKELSEFLYNYSI